MWQQGQWHPQALCHPPALIKGVLRLPNTSWGDTGGGSSGLCHSEMLISHRQRIISSHISSAEAVPADLWAMLGYQCYCLAESSQMITGRLIHPCQRTGICVCQTQQAEGWVPDSSSWAMAGGTGKDPGSTNFLSIPLHSIPADHKDTGSRLFLPARVKNTTGCSISTVHSWCMFVSTLSLPSNGANLQTHPCPHKLHPYHEHPPSIRVIHAVPPLGQLRSPLWAQTDSLLTKVHVQNASYSPVNAIPTSDSYYLLKPLSRTDSQLPPNSNRWKELLQLRNSSSPRVLVSTKSCSTAVIQIIFNYLVTN